MRIFHKRGLSFLLDKAEKRHKEIEESEDGILYYDELAILQGQIDLLQQMIRMIDKEQEEIFFRL